MHHCAVLNIRMYVLLFYVNIRWLAKLEPQLRNPSGSLRRVLSEMPSGKEPTKTLQGPLAASPPPPDGATPEPAPGKGT